MTGGPGEWADEPTDPDDFDAADLLDPPDVALDTAIEFDDGTDDKVPAPAVGVVRKGSLEEPVESAPEPPALYCASLEVWVREQLAPMYRRQLAREQSERVWCPEWWRHPEAVARLDALWRAWEHLRLEPALGMSVWFRDHADPHMSVLMDAHGPLQGCSSEGHGRNPVGPLALVDPPAALFST